MQRNSLVNSLGLFSLLAITSVVRGGIIVDHQPQPYGGLAADTDFVYVDQPNYWNLDADDFSLNSPATVGHIVFWGCYGGTFGGNVNPPTGPETISVRFYETRSDDALPGNVLYEGKLLNPSRVWTGGYVDTVHPQFRFESDLPTPASFSANTRYWLEVVQSGIPDSEFRWEFSPSDGTDIAVINPAIPDWQHTGGTPPPNNAFQLWDTPEPDSLALVFLGIGAGIARRSGLGTAHPTT